MSASDERQDRPEDGEPSGNGGQIEDASNEAAEGEVVEPDSPQEQIVAAVLAKSFRGPVPAPDDLAEYERVLPGCADRLISLTERQSRHRQQIEKNLVNSDVKLASRGQTYGFIIGMTVIIGAIALIAVGSEIAGFVSLIVALASLVGVFVYSQIRANRRPEDEQDGAGTELAVRPRDEQ